MDLRQVVGVSYPTVEKEHGKFVTIHTANKAPTHLRKSFCGKHHGCSPCTPGLPSEHVKEMDRMQCSDSVPVQLGRVQYMLCTVLPGVPGGPHGPGSQRSHRCYNEEEVENNHLQN